MNRQVPVVVEMVSIYLDNANLECDRQTSSTSIQHNSNALKHPKALIELLSFETLLRSNQLLRRSTSNPSVKVSIPPTFTPGCAFLRCLDSFASLSIAQFDDVGKAKVVLPASTEIQEHGHP